MKRDNFSKTREKNIMFTSCEGLIVTSKICSFSERMQDRADSENKKSTFTESKSLEAKCHKKENYDNVMCKTPIFSLPSFIRIRATDREGNTIEVTY